MREIKFKAWDNVNKEMYEVGYIDFPSKKAQLAIIQDGICYKAFEADLKDIKLLQYTGLKDSKGNEIYEGDIVQVREEDSFVPNHDSGGGIIDYDCVDGYSQLGVVSFKGAWYTYETKQHLEGREEQIYAPLDFTNDLFVVGNIHENVDLLNGGKNK